MQGTLTPQHSTSNCSPSFASSEHSDPVLVRLLDLMRQSEAADFVRDFQQWRPGNSVCELLTLKELGLACPEAITFVTELLQLDPR